MKKINTNKKTNTAAKKPLNLETVKTYIRNNMATWEMVEAHFGYDRTTIQRKLKASYQIEACYKKLLKRVQENTRLRKQADEILASQPKDVIIAETGYLMKVGLDEILKKGMDIIIPKFCESELEKLSPNFSSAEKILAQIREVRASNGPISFVNLEANILFEEPPFYMKRRSKGIVAVCCDVYASNPGDRTIHLLTTSYEVAELAKAQGFGSTLDLVFIPKKS